jgi:hypothetical protein
LYVFTFLFFCPLFPGTYLEWQKIH